MEIKKVHARKETLLGWRGPSWDVTNIEFMAIAKTVLLIMVTPINTTVSYKWYLIYWQQKTTTKIFSLLPVEILILHAVYVWKICQVKLQQSQCPLSAISQPATQISHYPPCQEKRHAYPSNFHCIQGKLKHQKNISTCRNCN